MENGSNLGGERRTFVLSVEQSRYIDEKVASGGYESPSDVLRAGLSALQEQDATIDLWLKDEVVTVYDAMEADPARGLTAENVAEQLQAHHAARSNPRHRGS